jgi:hypothetical protein
MGQPLDLAGFSLIGTHPCPPHQLLDAPGQRGLAQVHDAATLAKILSLARATALRSRWSLMSMHPGYQSNVYNAIDEIICKNN